MMDDKIWLVAEEEPVDERDPLDVVNEIYERLGLPAHAEGIPHDPAAHWNKIKRDDNRPENLTILSQATHTGEVVCPYCKGTFCIK